MPSWKELKSAVDYREVLDQHDTLLFDCDGVIWTGGSADELLPNVLEALKHFHEQGKTIAFVTNNATCSTKQYAQKFKKLGIAEALGLQDDTEGLEKVIFSSGRASARYVAQHVLPKCKEGSRRVFLIGQASLEEELRHHGVEFSGGTDPDHQVILPPQDFSTIKSDPSIGVVLVSFAMQLTYKLYALAYNHLASNDGCRLVITNEDTDVLLADGGKAPGDGALAAPLRMALKKGEEAIVVGKPHKHMLDMVQESLSFDPKRTVFFGDRLQSDVKFARNGGLTSVLVLSGSSTLDDLSDSLGGHETPHFVADSLGHFTKAREPLPN